LIKKNKNNKQYLYYFYKNKKNVNILKNKKIAILAIKNKFSTKQTFSTL